MILALTFFNASAMVYVMPPGGKREGSGRKPGRVANVNINVRIPEAELEAAKTAAKEQGYPERKFSEWVREAIRRFL
jgi:hypothetical protein